MGKTLLGGDEQIRDYTIAKKDMVLNFMAGADWNISDGQNNAQIIGLADAVEQTSPATLAQLTAAIASVNSSLNSFLEFKGTLDASNSTAFEAAAHSKGDFYKISVSGDILGVTVNAGDNLYFVNDVLATALVDTDYDVVDNTESADILRIADVIDSLLSQNVAAPLSANQGYELKALIDALSAKVNLRKYGESLTATQSSPILPATAQLPIAGTLRVYRNGSRMFEGSGNDYTANYSTGVITFEFPLKAQDTIVVDYEY